MVGFATKSWRNAMDVAKLQSSFPAGIARPVRILWSSGEMAIATSPPTLQRKPRPKIPGSIHSRRPRERPDRFRDQWTVDSGQSTVIDYWSLVTVH